MPATFVVVPLWQGSVSSRAMSLADGAAAILGDLPSSATVTVDVPVEAGESLGTGVRRYSTIRRVRDAAAEALALVPDWALTIGGDCGTSLAAVAHAVERTGGDLAVLWLDAHPDLNTPESSPSGGFGGMALRAITGEGADGLALDEATRVPPARLVLGGVRAIDDEERRFIDEHEIPVLTVEDLSDPTVVIGELEATGASHVFVHVDLDVLDPSALAGLSYPMPFGVGAAELATLLREVAGRFPLAGAAIAGFTPASPETAVDDLPTILRLVGALTSGSRQGS
ncbi:arginase family protein [Agromyces sp. H3Y2-19a]|uniref:arginase family protein n=1 Tax=Agromyces chromiiresistens TaxID=3030835 RepID=UPI0023B94ECE|nr:arginase family protein [Agromyces chromiiresistens]MDF0514747.1 arginase family protein [Agromyces chromiiresistens]